MKQLYIVVLLVEALLTWSLPAQALKPNDPKTKPTVFWYVVQEPDPALLRGWKCTTPVTLETGHPDLNSMGCWLYKFPGGFALYFDRMARDGRKRYKGWQSWTIRGKQISISGITIYTENEEVFFRWQNERPVKMKRIAPPR